ncbi:hypothetical protein DUI87_03111 [Hirundo rustica rustica]|uniref:RFX1-4/6/8-like BCD domain-containing protein n=1 Tax=Hirundo rustica rustica TaxID=333673 RepID=A0A3M0L2H3_HIRRU|nr:hypothetical protein DUI87_03111 [Hirundo rustica rustica]
MTLQQQSTLEQWAAWLDNVMVQALKPYEGRPSFPKAARQFLLKWSFYSSMVIRDLTLRSAASFGSFHLIRLLYDEYMFYLVEHRVAQATGETPIAVMGEKIDVDIQLIVHQTEADVVILDDHYIMFNLISYESSEVESEIEGMDENGEPQAKREKTDLNQAFQLEVAIPHGECDVSTDDLSNIFVP